MKQSLNGICLLLLFIATLSLPGCSSILNTCGRPLEYAVVESFFDDIVRSMLEEDDLSKAAGSIPAFLKLTEALIKRHPKKNRLQEIAAMGYNYYALALMELKSKDPYINSHEREQYLSAARKNYLKARDYAINIIDRHHKGFKKVAISGHPKELSEFIKVLTKKDVPALTWLTMGWVLYINITRHDSFALAQINKAQIIAKELYRLQPDYFYGLPTLFIGAINFALPQITGQARSSHNFFQEARNFHNDRFLLSKLMQIMFQFMESEGDNENLEAKYRQARKMLNEIISAPDDLFPEMRLTNEVAKLWAHYLLHETDSFLQEAEHTIRMCTIVYKDTIWHKSLKDISEKIYQETNGKVKFRIIPSDYSEAEDKVLNELKKGHCDAASLLTPGFVTNQAPAASFFELPFYYKNQEFLRCVVNELIDVIDLQYESKGVTFLNLIPIGNVHIYSSHEFSTFNGIRTKKMWIIKGHKFSEKIVKKVKLQPVLSPLKDVKSKVRQGDIHIVYGSAVQMITLGWFSEFTHISSMNDTFGTTFGASIIRNDVWQNLPDDYRSVVRKHFLSVISKDFFDLIRQENKNSYRAMTELAGLKAVSFPQNDRNTIYELSLESIDELIEEKQISPALFQRFGEVSRFCKQN